MLLDGRPDLNPYLPTSLAFHAWSRRGQRERGERQNAEQQ